MIFHQGHSQECSLANDLDFCLLQQTERNPSSCLMFYLGLREARKRHLKKKHLVWPFLSFTGHLA